MTSGEDVELGIRYDGREASAQLDKAAAALGRLEGAERSAQKTADGVFGKQFLTNIASFTAGFLSVRAAIGFVTDSLKAQAEQESAINSLNMALASQGKLVGDTSKNLIEYAEALQLTTTFSDDAIEGAESLFATFGLGEADIKRATKAAADFAARTGQDIESAAKMVAMGAQGMGRAFKAYGIEVKETGDKSKDLNGILSQLEGRFSGSATAATQTFTGAMKQLSNQWGELQEASGKAIGFITSNGESAFGGLTSVLQRLAYFISHDVIIAFSELKAQIAETLGAIVGFIEKTFDLLGKLPGGAAFRRIAEDAGLMKDSLLDSARSFREQGDAAAAGAGVLANVSNTVVDAAAKQKLLAEGLGLFNKLSAEQRAGFVKTDENLIGLATAYEDFKAKTFGVDAAAQSLIATQKKATEAARAQAAEVLKLSLAMRGMQDPTELGKIEAAIAKAGGAAALGKDAVLQYGESLAKAATHGQALGTQSAALVERFNGIQTATKEGAKALDEHNKLMAEQVRIANLLGPSQQVVTDGFNDLARAIELASEGTGDFARLSDANLETVVTRLNELLEAAEALGVKIPGLGADFTRALEEWTRRGKELPGFMFKTGEATKGAKKEAIKFSEVLQVAANSAQLLGHTKLGDFINSLIAAAAAGEQAAAAIKAMGEASTKAGKAAAVAMVAAAAASTASNIWSSNKQNLSAKGGFVSGASQGAAFGAKASGGNPYVTVAAAAIGSLIGLFAGSKFRKIAKDAGRILGTTLSKEMVAKIQEDSKKLGITVASAALLNISGAVEESGKKWGAFGSQILALQKGIANGTIPMKEGLEQVRQAWSGVRDEAELAGRIGDRLTRQMIEQARATGTLTDEMKGFLQERAAMLAEGAAGLTGLIPTTEEEGRALAGNFIAAFSAAIGELGLVQAADAFREAFAGVREMLAKTLGEDLASQVFAPIAGIFDMTAEGSPFRGAAEAGDALKKIVVGLADTGRLTQAQFTNMGISARNAFNQAMAATGDQRTSLEAILPYLQAAVSAADQYGYSLDANTQALVDQARAAGFAFPVDPVTRMASAIETMVVAMNKAFNLGMDLGDAFDRAAVSASGAATAVSSIPSSVPAPGEGALGGGAGSPAASPTAATSVTYNVHTDLSLTSNDNPFGTLQSIADAKRNVIEWARQAFEDANADVVAALPEPT